MTSARATKPICQACGFPNVVIQRTMADGKIYYVHPWHVSDLARMIARGAPVVPES